MPGFVSGFAVIDCCLKVFLRRNAWRHILRARHAADLVAVVRHGEDPGLCALAWSL